MGVGCPRGRARRRAVRLQAAGWFADGVSVREVARRLRVTQTAVCGWRAGGEQAGRGVEGVGRVSVPA
ncbi:helix-turn-helix domain-containing protein [Micromonospora gifhornensis]|uniref:helix-turn-helix domain-containing protein n=1 Tax=Micromonospora gifhornensis TaxID=84594 RepID=UPI003D734FA1